MARVHCHSRSCICIFSISGTFRNLYQFDIKGEPLSQALQEYGIKTSRQLIFSEDLVRGQKAPALQGRYTPEQALAFLLEKTDLVAKPDGAGVLMIERKKTIERRLGTH